MGSLFIELGQCGCQIGSQLNPKLASSYYCTRTQPPHRLHTLMLDTEPKVLQQYLQHPPKWLDPANVKYFQYGRGNNWSYGYLHHLPKQAYHNEILPQHKQFSHQKDTAMLEHYLEENRQICDYVMDSIRRQLETVDCPIAINIIASLGGGTGSGIGTKLIECLRQNFQLDLYAHVILPNKSGQTPLQAYNCSLSLASLQKHCTAIFTHQNDHLLTLSQGTQSPSLQQINKALAGNISKLVQINETTYHRFYNQIINSNVVSPQANYLTLLGTQQNDKQGWEDIFESLFQQLKVYNHDDYVNREWNQGKIGKQKLIKGELLLVGKIDSEYQKLYEKKMKMLVGSMFNDSLYWEQIYGKGKEIVRTMTNVDKKMLQRQKEKEKEKKEALLLMNHGHIVRYLSYLTYCGRKKLKAKAYLWHYRYADLQSAFDELDIVINQYQYFTKM